MALGATVSLFLFLVCWSCSNGLQDPSKMIGKIKYGVKIDSATDDPSVSERQVLKRSLSEDATVSFNIVEHYDSSVNEGISTNIRDRIKNTIIPKLKEFLLSTLSVRPLQGPILLERDCTGGTFFQSNTAPTIQCATTCQSQTMCGPAIVPEDHLKLCIECNGNSNNCMENGENGRGVNASFVLYVSAITTGSCPTQPATDSQNAAPSTIAFASSCQMESEYDRPIAGNVNFCPNAFTDDSSDDFILDVTKHEIFHALAFSSDLYPFWRDSDGNPRTERDSNNNPPTENNAFTWSDDTIVEVTYNDWEIFSGTTSHSVYLLVTPAVLMVAREYFDCPSLQGVELENQGGDGTMLSHWEKRILGNEFMTGIVDPNPVVSVFSLALLTDSGWYKVKLSMAEELLYGRSAGCTFASGSCLSYIREEEENDNGILPFCTVNGNNFGCSVERQFIAKCSLVNFTQALPSEYQYFSNAATGGSTEIADYCPTFISNFKLNLGVGVTIGTDCTDPSNQPPSNSNFRGETYGSDSRCLTHNPRWTFNRATSTPFGAGCYQTSPDCSTGDLEFSVQGQSYQCSLSDDTVMINVDGYVGGIVCPDLFETGFCMDSNFSTIVTPTTETTDEPTTEPTTDSPPPSAGSMRGPSFVAFAIGGISLIIIWSAIHDYIRLY